MKEHNARLEHLRERLTQIQLGNDSPVIAAMKLEALAANAINLARDLAAEIAPAALTRPAHPTVWLILFDDSDRRPEVIFHEDAARKRYADISVSWNAHLFVKTDTNSKDARGSYTDLVLTPVSPETRAAVGVALANIEEFGSHEMFALGSIHELLKTVAGSARQPQHEQNHEA